MRIALVTSALNQGGIAEVLCSTALAFARDGHDVLVLALRMAEISNTAAEYRRRLSTSPRITLFEGTSKSLKPVAGLAEAGRQMREALEGFRPQVIHAHGEGADLTVALYAPRGIPRVRTAHIDYYLRRYLWLGGLFVEPAINIFGGYGTVIGISEQTMKRNRRSANTVLIHNGVFDETRLPQRVAHEQNEMPMAGIVGTLLPHKGQVAFLKALKRRYSDPADIPFCICIYGDGPDREAVTVLAEDFSGKVHLRGHVENRDKIYAGLDVLLVPSTNEGLSTAMLEAIARGVPVLSLPVAGASDVLGRWDCGSIVPGLSQMIECLKDWRSIPVAESQRLDVVQAFLTATAADKHEAAYQHILDRSR